MGKNYVGIDPSTSTGLVVLSEAGFVVMQTEIKTKSKSDPERFIEISEKLYRILDGWDDDIYIEGFSYGSKGKGVSTQYGIGWTIRSDIKRKGHSYTEISPSALKKFATGKGNTKKENMILPIYQKWGFQHDSDNIRDAYVLAQIGRYLDGLEKPTKYQAEVLKNIRG